MNSDLISILLCDKKSKLDKICREGFVSSSDLYSLIVASKAEKSSWYHFRKHFHYVPAARELTETDLENLAQNKDTRLVGKALASLNKLYALIDERRCLSLHLFVHRIDASWHILFFDQKDTDERRNHWKEGPHLHLVNYLTYFQNPFDLWDSIVSASERPKSKFHIRYERSED